MVCSGGPLLLRAWMQQVAQLKRDHTIEVIWVTSGAIASAVEDALSPFGIRILQFPIRPNDLSLLLGAAGAG